MNKFFSHPRKNSWYLIVAGLAIVTVDLIRHPEEWKNWLNRLGILLIFIVVLFFAVRMIRFLKERKPGM